MKTRPTVIDVFQRTNVFISFRHMKKKNKEIPGSYYFSLFALSNLLTQTCLHFCTTELLTSSEHAKSTFIIEFVCLSVPHTVAYFDAAKFSIKLFSFIYFPVSVVRQWDEYEIVTT